MLRNDFYTRDEGLRRRYGFVGRAAPRTVELMLSESAASRDMFAYSAVFLIVALVGTPLCFSWSGIGAPAQVYWSSFNFSYTHRSYLSTPALVLERAE